MLKRFIGVLLLGMLLSSCGMTATSQEVKVSGRHILVNDSIYTIKGICYHPVSKGKEKRSFENLSEDLALMTEAGINTIRVYEPINDVAVLDQIYAAGLKVIIGFGYNQEGNHDILSGTFIDYVNEFKNHGAVLLWELGNEYNYHPEWFEGNIENWYKAMNNAADLIHENDPLHLVTTAHGELPTELVLAASSNIDVWGMNVYRGDNPTSIFSEWSAISSKPMYLSEAGGDSYMTIAKQGYQQGINEEVQADANANILNAVFDNRNICSGVAMFSFTDGWWKAGNPSIQDVGGFAPNSTSVPYDGAPNEEYWGMVDLERNKKRTFDIIKLKYKSISE